MAVMLGLILSASATGLTGTVTIGGKAVPAVYRQLSSTTVALGNGRNACVSHYVKGFLSVPGTVEIADTQYTVTEISDLAFRLCEGITGVEIGESVTRVGTFAFIGCPAISEIILPESMQSLGSGAFQSCLSSLRTVTCKSATPPRWEYNDVFVFHAKGIGDNAAGVIPAATRLYVPDEDTYREANYTNPEIGWTTADGWGSFSYVHIGQASFHIDTPAKLQVLREIVNVGHMYAQFAAVYLDADIDMSGYQWDCGMGVSEEEAFEGSFNGNGHTISNLTIDTDNYGGFFSHYGGHFINDVTFKNCTFKCDRADLTKYPNGVFGAVVGECGALLIRNVCLDNCQLISAFNTNGFMMGRCLTAGGADFINCVVKDCTYFFSANNSVNGDLVGQCYGGSATDCAIFNTQFTSDLCWMPLPFVGKCADNEDFNVTRCYTTRQSFGMRPSITTPSYAYQMPDNVICTNVVVDKDRSVNYTAADGTAASITFPFTYNGTAKNAFFKTLFMIPELGLEHWAYQEGEYPVPAEMMHLLPEPQVNHVTYCPKTMLNRLPRVNCLSPTSYITPERWYDLNPATGYMSNNFITSRLWIDDDFTAEDAPSSQYSVHNTKLPIGTARITSTGGIDYDRTLAVTKKGTANYTLPVAVLDAQGNPVYDEDGFIVTDGEQTLYQYDTYTSTDYTVYLPYELKVNGGATVYQPVGVRHDGTTVIMEMRIVDDGIIRPWRPYYIMVSNAPVKLGVNYEIVVEPRDTGVTHISFEDDKYRMYGTSGKFTPPFEMMAYQLQEDDTWQFDDSTMLPFTCYLINNSGENVEHFAAVTQLVLSDTGDNESRIETYDGKVVDVVLDGRTFYKDNTWYTLCLPFDLADKDGTPLEDAQVCRFYGADYDEDNGTLRVQFVNNSIIEAGKPYMMRWNDGPRIKDPIFENVTIKNKAPGMDRIGAVAFVGTYSPVLLPGENDKLLFMGDDNQLFFPEEPTTINAFRSFFILGGAVSTALPAASRRVLLSVEDNVETGITDVEVKQPVRDDNWYTIDGRVLRSQPSTPGIYIHNGTKILIR